MIEARPTARDVALVAAALGIVAGLSLRHGLSTSATAVAGSGFLGAYTTFSTFVVEAVRAGGEATGDGVRVAIRYVAAIAGLAATGAY